MKALTVCQPFAAALLGPKRIVTTKPIAFPEPVPWLGALGLLDVPDEIIMAQFPDLNDPYAKLTTRGPRKATT